MNVAIYCGATPGTNPCFMQESVELVAKLADAGADIVYGGSRVGLMGAIADTALAHGAQVTGVEPSFLIETSGLHEGITELIEVETLPERRQIMIDLSDAFIALPGGIGTLDEVTEVIQLAKLDQLNKPIVVFNVDGCYDALKKLLNDMVENGFMAPLDNISLIFATSKEEAFQAVLCTE